MDELKNKRLVWDFDSPIYASIAIATKNADEQGLEEVPKEFAFKALKTTIQGLLDKAGHEDVVLYLTGRNNFRKALGTILPYKGNRPPKPPLYDEVRDYAVRAWKAIVVDEMEAEDMAAIDYNQNPEHSILIGLDKDLLQVPGYHYNPNKNTVSTISPSEGNLHLWKQVLTGDRIDNVLGIPGLGDKTAQKLLQGVRSYRQGWDVACTAYKNAFLNKRCMQVESDGKVRWVFERGSGLVRHDGTTIDWREAMIETGRLVYLLRQENDEFEVL